MTNYVKVYSPANEMFEVSRNIADTLILEQGWTQSPVKVVEVPSNKKSSETVESKANEED